MGSPAESFLGEVRLERWLGKGMQGGGAILEASPAPPPSAAPAGLPATASHALDFLLRLPRVDEGFACRGLMILSSFPYRPAGDGTEGAEETECRVAAALLPARLMSGRKDAAEIDRGLTRRLLAVPQDRASPAFLGRMLLSLTEALEGADSPEARRAARGVFEALKKRAVEKWDMAFFPPGPGHAAQLSRDAAAPSRMSEGSAAEAVLAYGRFTGDGEAMELAQRLARIHALGLDEQNGAHVFAGLLRFGEREFFQIRAQRDGIGQQLIALAGMARDDAQRQLDHVGGFELRCRDAVQDVGGMFGARGCGGELDDAGGQHVAQRGEG